jgi:adenylosuccinate synthase
VTHSLRRVAAFDPEIVRQAIAVNQPTRIVMNHLDYIDQRNSGDAQSISDPTARFVARVESDIQRRIQFYGVSAAALLAAPSRLTAVV